MSDETANQDIENTANNVKNLEEAMAVVKKMEKKIFEVINTVLFGLPINKFECFKDLN